MAKRTQNKGMARFISVMLSVMLAVNSLGLSAFAAEDSESTQQSVTETVLSEPEDESTEEQTKESADESTDEQTQDSADEPTEKPVQDSEDESTEGQPQGSEDELDEEQPQDSDKQTDEQSDEQSDEAVRSTDNADNADSKDNAKGAKGVENAKAAGDSKEVSAWAALQEQINAAEDGATITVNDAVTAGPEDTALTIPEDKSITLKLVGTLDRGLNEATADGSVIINNGDLTITGGGTITGGNTTGDGGGIKSNGALTIEDVRIEGNHAKGDGGGVYANIENEEYEVKMTGGVITGNSAENGGGAFILYCDLTMDDGVITGNSAKNGGGLYIQGCGMYLEGGSIDNNEAAFGAGLYAMSSEVYHSGGNIDENRAESQGGGVYLQAFRYDMDGGSISGNRAENGAAVYVDDGKFTLEGGTICENTSTDGAIYLFNSDSVKLFIGYYGVITVTGNKNKLGEESNIYLRRGQLITVTSTPADGSQIGISTMDKPTPGHYLENYLKFAYLYYGIDRIKTSRCFTSDADFTVDFIDDALYLQNKRVETWSQLQLALRDGGEPEWDASIEGFIHIIRLAGNITADSDDSGLYCYDGDVILDLCGYTIDRDLTGLPKTQTDGYVLKMDGGKLTIRDSKGGGKITGGNSSSGGGIYIDHGTVTLEGGEITGNRANYGGGVYIEGGVFRQTGGSISGNSAMLGGGVYVKSSDTYEISGKPVVIGNLDESDRPCNVYVDDNTTIHVTGELLDGAKLGVGSGSGHTFTSGFAAHHDESISAEQYFENDDRYCLYFDQNREIAWEIEHDAQPVWTWTETETGAQATLEMKCVNCGEVEWSETVTEFEGPGAYSEENEGFGFTAEVSRDGETYSDTNYVAPEHKDAVDPDIDNEGEYHSGMYEHYVLTFGGSTYYYKADGDKPGEATTLEGLTWDQFIIDGDMIYFYCGPYGDEETIITLPGSYNGTALKYIGNGTGLFYDDLYEGAMTIDVTNMAENKPIVSPGAFQGRENVKIIGPHACGLERGQHGDEHNSYTVEFTDEHIFQAVNELTEWSENYSTAVIHIQCIRESCCYYDVAITDTTVTDELIDGKIVYFATGTYNGYEYMVTTMEDPYTVILDPDNGTGEGKELICAKSYTLPDADEVTFTAPAGTVFYGWKDESGTEYEPGTPVQLSAEKTTFIAVWRSEWALVNSVLQEGGVVTLRNDITAGEDDVALTVPAETTATLNLSGYTVNRGLSASVEDGYVVKVDGTLNLLSRASSAGGSGSTAEVDNGLITGGYNSGDGGGIFVSEGGNVDIKNVDIKSNQAGNGAGVYVASGGLASILGSSIMSNIASGKGGGGFVSETAKLFVNEGTRIVENVASEGAGIYIKAEGCTTVTGPDVKVKNNCKPNGDHNNIHPEQIENVVDPVVISGSLEGVFVGVTLAEEGEVAPYVAAIASAYAISEIIKHVIYDVSNKNDRKDQEDPCDHPRRRDSWVWNADYSKATAQLFCIKCGNMVSETDNDPIKNVGADKVTTYTARVQYKDQEFEDTKQVEPFIVTLEPGYYSVADPVVERVAHDIHKNGSFQLYVPASFIPTVPALPDKWLNNNTLKTNQLTERVEISENTSFTLKWLWLHRIMYKKGAEDATGSEREFTVEHDEGHELLPCWFKREHYDFTKWRITDATTGAVLDEKEAGVKYKVETDVYATALWQSKWTTLGNRMTNPRENETTITLYESVQAQEGDKELLVPEGKTVTLNMNGFTLDRNLTAATEDGSVIRVKGTLILNGPGTLKGGFSTDSASGIILEDGGTLKISGSLVIIRNGVDDGGMLPSGNGSGSSGSGGKNVYVPENAKIIVTDSLDEAKIGITTEKKPEADSPVVFTDGLKNKGDKDNFISDDSEYIVDLNGAGEAMLAEKPTVKIKGVTGSFNDKIKMNYYFVIPQSLLADTGAYVTITKEGDEANPVTILIKDAEKDAENAYKFSIPLAAKEASDIITARVYSSDGKPVRIIAEESGKDHTESGVQCTLMQYFEWLGNHGTSNDKKIGAAAIDYCSAAQIYFDYKASGLSVSSAVDAVTEADLDDYVSIRDGKLPGGVTIKGITAMLESDNTLRLYYNFKNEDLSGLTFEIDGTTAELIERKDGSKYLALDTGVYSNHLQDTHTYTVSDGSKSYTITASVLTYARSLVLKKDKDTKNLGKALYLYNKAAIEVFGQ